MLSERLDLYVVNVTIAEPVRFPCLHCGRILTAPASVWGTQQPCPYCQRFVNVPSDSPISSPIPPVQVPVVTAPVSPATQPQPAAEDELWAPGESAPAEQQQYVPVHCRVCDTRMYATVAQVGSDIECPDCGAKTKVKMVATKKGQAPPISVPGEGYELSEPPLAMTEQLVGYGQPLTTMLGVLDHLDQEATAAREKLIQKRKKRRPPKLWMLQGIFLYPFTLSVLPYVVLVATLCPIAYYLALFIHMVSQIQVVAVGAVFIVLIETVIVGFAASYLATLLVGVAEVSSDGDDNVANEFDAVIADRVLRMLFVAMGWIYAIAPGAIFNLLAGSPPPWQVIPNTPLSYPLLISWFLLLPLTQLSVLEASSMAVPLSYPILRGMWPNRWAWLAFYGVSAVVVLAAAGCVALSMLTVEMLFPPLRLWLLSFGLILSTVVYYRLMGRLAWYCAEHTRPLETKRSLDPYEPLYP